MKKRIIGSWVALVTVFLLLTTVQGTVIKEGNIVLLRSQFISNTVSVDGRLTDDDWDFAGSILLQYGSGENQTDVDIFLMNNENSLYIGFRVSEEGPSENSSATVFFDVDGDGNLTTPEDAKQVYFDNTFTPRDFYFDGSLWAVDKTEQADFTGAGRNADGLTIYEMKIDLLAEDLQYDGLRVANPSNTFIGLNFLVSVSDNGTRRTFSYPASSLNASAYIDTKLAGPEDQDLPEYIPPVVETQTDTQDTIDEFVTEFADLDAAGLGYTSFVLSLAIILGVRRRRR